MSEDFDLLVYIKGDRKPVFLNNAQLILEYEGESPITPAEADLALTKLTVPLTVSGQKIDSRIKELSVQACNQDADGDPTDASGVVTLTGTSQLSNTVVASFSRVFSGLAPGSCVDDGDGDGESDVDFTWQAPDQRDSIAWTAEVTVTGEVTDPNSGNNTATGLTLVFPLRK